MLDEATAAEAEPTPSASSEPGLASHVVALPGGSWLLWRALCVRGAGFPAASLLRLAAPESSRLADRYLDEEESARERALASASRALAAAAGDRAQRKRAKRALKRLARDPSALASVADSDDEARRAGLQELRHELGRAFAADEVEAGAALKELARDPSFREAVVWQNRHAYHTGVAPLLGRPAGPGRRKDRHKEHLVARYLQRYCAKNDTIGFFGPLSWGRIVDDGPAIRLAPGPALLAQRQLHFEAWAIDALARRLDESGAVRDWVAPRLQPYVRLDGRTLRVPGQAPVELGLEHARLLAGCDGVTSARDLAERLLADRELALRSAADVYHLLELSQRSGLVSWSLEGPLEVDPERRLRRRLETVTDDGVRASCLAALAELEDARAEVARAAGDAERLDRALEALEGAFSRVTGARATRRPGETYAARTLVYEDCRRDVELAVGPEFVSHLGPPLSLVLAAARWGTAEIARRYRGEFERAYSEAALARGAGAVELMAVLDRIPALMGGEEHAIPGAVAEEIARRWAAVLGLPLAAREVALDSQTLRPLVARAFAVEEPGWRWPRYVSPDVMIAAADAGAIGRGRYRIVLGEVHAVNSLLQSFTTTQHPNPQELVAALERDHPEPCVTVVVGKADTNQRTNISVLPPKAFRYESAPDGPGGDPSRALRPADLLMERTAAGLEVRTRDGRVRFDVIDFFAHALSYGQAVMMDPLGLPRAGHVPRITIDGVVVWRERWWFAPSQLGFARLTDPAERFLAVRRWARENGLPRFVFFKVPVERKPCYLDLDAPLYVDDFCKLVRSTAASERGETPVGVTEMLPRLDEAWLVDAEGRRYTCELRMAALDASPTGRPGSR